jgi:cobalt-zinc-cadmium efflux system protein
MNQRQSLIAAIALNLIITLSQMVGAYVANSRAVFSDALHNLSDVAALVVSLVALNAAARRYTARASFGYRRAEVLAGLINATTIGGIGLFISIESIQNLWSGRAEVIDAQLVIWLSAIAIAANFGSVLLLRRQEGNANLRSATLHLLGDGLFSVAVLLGALAMRFKGWFWLDDVLSLAISAYLVAMGIRLIAKTSAVLLHLTPQEYALVDLAHAAQEVEGVANIHHIHVWRLAEEEVHFQAHVDLEEDVPLSEANRICQRLEQHLKQRFHLDHVILQPEFGVDDDKSLVVQDPIPEPSALHRH